MINPSLETRTVVIACAATAAQALPEPAVAVLSAVFQNNNAAAGAPLAETPLPIVTGAPGANQLQFTGTTSAPSTALLLNGAAVVNTVLTVRYVPQGAMPAAV